MATTLATSIAPPILDPPRKQRRAGKKTVTPPPIDINTPIEHRPFSRSGYKIATHDVRRNGLPTFSWDEGYRLIDDPLTGETYEVPLTLFDVLYESEEDIGAVFMAQGKNHAMLIRVLSILLQTYLTTQKWLILNDVYIRWGDFTIQPKAPDIAAILVGEKSTDEALTDEASIDAQESYVVGRDGPKPSFVVEITSKRTRKTDLVMKKEFYASLGVQEYLIIDLLPPKNKNWQLIGYRLGEKPEYTKLMPDNDGGLSFETVGLRFVAINHTRVEVYDLATGEPLLTPDALKSQIEVETARADTAEAELKQLREWIAQQQAVQRIGQI